MKRRCLAAVCSSLPVILGSCLAGAPAPAHAGSETPAPGLPRSAEKRPGLLPPPPEPRRGKPALKPYLADTDQAIRLFEGRVRKNPDDFTSYRYLGRLYDKKAKESGQFAYYERAEEALRKSLQLFPDHLRTEADLAAVLCTQHKFAEGLAIARRLHEQYPKDPDALATMGDALQEVGRYDEAEESFRKLFRLAPLPAVTARLAGLAELRGNLEEARKLMGQAAEKAREQGGPEGAAWYLGRLGDLALSAGKLDEAERQYRAVPEGVDAYHDATFGLGRVRLAQGRPDEAVVLFKKAVGIGPDAHMLAALGDLYLSQGKKELAEPLFEQLERQTQGKATYYRERALFFADHHRNLPEALALAEKDLAQRNDVFGWDALAWALYRNGRAEEAARAMEEALKLGTQDARLQYHAGMIASRLGQKEKAREHLSRALALHPSFSPVQIEEARRTLAALNGEPGARSDRGASSPAGSPQ